MRRAGMPRAAAASAQGSAKAPGSRSSRSRPSSAPAGRPRARPGRIVHWSPYQPRAGSQPSWTPTTVASTEAVRNSGSAATIADPLPPPRRRPPPAQRAGAHQRGDEDGDRQRHGHQQQRGAERLHDVGHDLGPGDPGPSGVTAREPAEPVPEQPQRPGVEAELGPDVGQHGRGGLALRRPRLEHGERRVGAGQPGQQADPAHEERGEHEHATAACPHDPARVSAAFRCRPACARTDRGARPVRRRRRR